MNILTTAKRLTVPALLGLVIAAHVPAHVPSASKAGATHAAHGLLPTPLPVVTPAMGFWIQYTNPMTGISVWVDSADWSNVVISFGQKRAKELTKMSSPERLRNCQLAAQAFGNYLMAFNHLYHGQVPYAAVRNGQSVGLWVHVRVPNSIFAPSEFIIRSVTQRPVGSTTPPSSMLR